METKEQLVNNIKEWIKMDTEISQLQSEMKDRRNKKKLLSDTVWFLSYITKSIKSQFSFEEQMSRV